MLGLNWNEPFSFAALSSWRCSLLKAKLWKVRCPEIPWKTPWRSPSALLSLWKPTTTTTKTICRLQCPSLWWTTAPWQQRRAARSSRASAVLYRLAWWCWLPASWSRPSPIVLTLMAPQSPTLAWRCCRPAWPCSASAPPAGSFGVKKRKRSVDGRARPRWSPTTGSSNDRWMF